MSLHTGYTIGTVATLLVTCPVTSVKFRYLQFNTCNWTGDQQCTVLGMGHMCVTQSDTFRYAPTTQILFGVLGDGRWRSGTRGHRGLDTTTPNSKFANITRATRASPALAFFDARAPEEARQEAGPDVI